MPKLWMGLLRNIEGTLMDKVMNSLEQTESKAKGLQRFATELANRYGIVPESPIVDVEFHPTHRIFYIKSPDKEGSKEESTVLKVRTKSNCKKCYGFGYRGVFYSNEEDLRHTPLLDLCSCLHLIREEREEKDGEQGPGGSS